MAIGTDPLTGQVIMAAMYPSEQDEKGAAIGRPSMLSP
jgi:hypothetical protein